MGKSDPVEATVEQGSTISFGYSIHSFTFIGHLAIYLFCASLGTLEGLTYIPLIYYQILNLHSRMKLFIGIFIST